MFVPLLPRNLEASLRDLGSTKAETRASAAHDLARAADGDSANRSRAIAALEKALGDEVSAVRAASAVALADLKASEALPKLLVAIEDADAMVGQMALLALGEIRDDRALPRLRRCIQDERPAVRYQAVLAFTRIADQDEAADVIVKATSDSDENVRYIAIRAAEDRVADTRLREKVADRAEQLLSDSSPNVGIAAAIFLAKANRNAGRKLIESVVLGTVRVQKEEEREAVEMCGRLDMRDVQKELERRAWGLASKMRDTCAFQAKIALARMQHPRAVSEIEADLRSLKKETRDAAVVAVGRAKLRHLEKSIAEATDVDPDLRDAALKDLGE